MGISEDRSIHFRARQLQHTFRHASSFGVLDKMNSKSLRAFRLAVIRHVESSHTEMREGYYRNHPVTHFVDPRTGLNVMRLPTGEYLSAWCLSVAQLRYVLHTGKLGGNGHGKRF